jgi:hypothetical protein
VYRDGSGGSGQVIEGKGTAARDSDFETALVLTKLLKSWSGRRGSNRRRSAWEKDRRLKINDNGVYVGENRSKEFINFRHFARKSPLNGVKLE